MPCRHCLADIKAGEPYLILAHRPFPAAQPYAEQGPIFLHAESCPRHPDSEDAPRMFLEREAYLIRGYGADDRIVYGYGEDRRSRRHGGGGAARRSATRACATFTSARPATTATNAGSIRREALPAAGLAGRPTGQFAPRVRRTAWRCPRGAA